MLGLFLQKSILDSLCSSARSFFAERFFFGWNIYFISTRWPHIAFLKGENRFYAYVCVLQSDVNLVIIIFIKQDDVSFIPRVIMASKKQRRIVNFNGNLSPGIFVTLGKLFKTSCIEYAKTKTCEYCYFLHCRYRCS